MPTQTPLDYWLVAKRQLAVFSVFLLLFTLVLMVFYWKDREREWRLREEQATHRLELAFELISRDLERVRSDILYIASQQVVRSFDPGEDHARTKIENEFGNFLRLKRTCQQLRLIDVAGRESVRVDLRGAEVEVVPEARLQDKKDRYYVQESLRLRGGEIFVSEFDLNQEHGGIEKPLNPVIRFVTPVCDDEGKIQFLLVANYRGAALLHELAAISLPGQTFLIRQDGQYLLGPAVGDAWGWLLGHRNSFARQYSDAWKRARDTGQNCFLTSHGAFAFQEIQWRRFEGVPSEINPSEDDLVIVSYLPSEKVFETSNQLLRRLLLIVAVISLPLFVLTRVWAVASIRRKQQNSLILESEKKLRELSSRLVQIQEEERRTISREIHDQLGQQVTAINLDLKLAEREMPAISVRTQLRRAIEESEQLLVTLHDFATRIRPDVLDDLGLHDAVESHVWEFMNRSGIEVAMESNINGIQLPTVIAENVYRLIQESLNNVVRHANATCVDISIRRENEQGREVLQVNIRDDGVGTAVDIENPETARMDGTSRLGILGMRERVDLLGGTLELTSLPDQGTSITVRVPIAQPNNAVEPDKRG